MKWMKEKEKNNLMKWISPQPTCPSISLTWTRRASQPRLSQPLDHSSVYAYYDNKPLERAAQLLSGKWRLAAHLQPTTFHHHLGLTDLQLSRDLLLLIGNAAFSLLVRSLLLLFL
jgi:hypothetical protein